MHGSQGGCGGDDVRGGEDTGPVFPTYTDPGGHGHRPAEQEGAAGQSGVENIFADTAKEHFHHDDGKESTDGDLPVSDGGGTHIGQQHTGDTGGQVIGFIAYFSVMAPQLLKEEAAEHGEGSDGQRPETEEADRSDEGGGKGDEHIPHNGLGRDLGMDMGRAGDGHSIEEFHMCHDLPPPYRLLAAATMCLPERNASTRGTPAGQL